MIILAANKSIMRSKLPYNAFFEFRSHEKRADQEIESLLGILTSWSKIRPPEKVEFRSHEIQPPDPESLKIEFFNFEVIFAYVLFIILSLSMEIVIKNFYASKAESQFVLLLNSNFRFCAHNFGIKTIFSSLDFPSRFLWFFKSQTRSVSNELNFQRKFILNPNPLNALVWIGIIKSCNLTLKMSFLFPWDDNQFFHNWSFSTPKAQGALTFLTAQREKFLKAGSLHSPWPRNYRFSSFLGSLFPLQDLSNCDCAKCID